MILSAILALMAYVVLSLLDGKELEYGFEATIISINWLTLIVAGVRLALHFRRGAHT